MTARSPCLAPCLALSPPPPTVCFPHSAQCDGLERSHYPCAACSASASLWPSENPQGTTRSGEPQPARHLGDFSPGPTPSNRLNEPESSCLRALLMPFVLYLKGSCPCESPLPSRLGLHPLLHSLNVTLAARPSPVIYLKWSPDPHQHTFLSCFVFLPNT